MKRHFERQADYCTAFGAELTARLLRLLPDCISARSALGQRIAHWPGDPAPEAGNLPLRLAGGLHAYIWADQPERRTLTDAAISLNPPLPLRSSAIEFLRQRLAAPWTGCHLIYSTVAWQYFSQDEKSQITNLIATRGAEAKSPLAGLRIDADGKSPGAAMQLDLWPEQKQIELGRMDFHGRWITWTAPQPG